MADNTLFIIPLAICLVATSVKCSQDYQFSPLEDIETRDETNYKGDSQLYLNERSDRSLNINDNTVLHNDKRIPSFSVNGGLRSLTDMLYSRERANMASGRAGVRNTLLKLGKRFPENEYAGNSKSSQTSLQGDVSALPSGDVAKRRSDLSVSGPLSALANVLAAEGRRRHFTESRHNRMKLLQLGKRTSNLGEFLDSSSE